MRRFHKPSMLLAGLAAAMALAAGTLLNPPASGALPLQDQPEKKTMTISGTAMLPDGSPAARMPVEVKAPNKKLVGTGGAGGQAPPPELLAQSAGQQREPAMISLGKTTTDDQGNFAVKFELTEKPALQLEIGDKLKSAWLIRPLKNENKDINLGKVELRPKV